MSGASEASTDRNPPRRLYVSLAVRAESIKVGWGLESSDGERVSLTRVYLPPHGAASFVDDLNAVVEGLLGGDQLDALRALVIFPVK